MTTSELLQMCKTSMRITTDAYDSEITGYIEAALLDLGLAGVEYDAIDNLVAKAVMTYVRFSFGAPDNYDKLKASYDEQKAQMQNATNYTNWGVNNG